MKLLYTSTMKKKCKKRRQKMHDITTILYFPRKVCGVFVVMCVAGEDRFSVGDKSALSFPVQQCVCSVRLGGKKIDE